MLTTDIPPYRDVVRYYTDLLIQQDAETVAAQTERQQRTLSLGSAAIGLCRFTHDTTDVVTSLMVVLDDDLFYAKNPLDNHRLPLASLAVLEPKTETVICINAVLLSLFQHDNTKDVAYGVIAHEIAHAVLHAHQPPMTSPLPPTPLSTAHVVNMVGQRLKGEQCGGEDEFAANLFAVGLVGLASVMAMLVFQASYSYAVGVRMEFSNMIQKLMRVVIEDPTATEIPYTLNAVVLLPKAEWNRQPTST